MNLSRGDIVLADLPFSDRTASKVRPALVVQSNRNNSRLNDVILALVTSRNERAGYEPTQLLIDVSTQAGIQSGLLHSSTVKCEHLVTLDRRFLRRVIGRLPEPVMQQINSCLRAALELD